jgi:hypothetical protein
VCAEHAPEAGCACGCEHLGREPEVVLIDIALSWIRDAGAFAIRTFDEADATAERNERREVVRGAIEICLKADAGMRIRAKRAPHVKRPFDVEALLHVDPELDAAALRLVGEHQQSRLAALRIDVDPELRELHGDMAVDAAPLELAGNGDVMRCCLIGGNRVRDVFAQPRHHRADAEALQVRRRGERILEPLTGHEAADRAPDERERRDVLPQPRVLRADEKGVPDYPIRSIVL